MKSSMWTGIIPECNIIVRRILESRREPKNYVIFVITHVFQCVGRCGVSTGFQKVPSSIVFKTNYLN